MSDDYKVGLVAIISVAAIFLALIGLWYTHVQAGHNFDIECVKSNKHLIYETLPGQTTPTKECK